MTQAPIFSDLTPFRTYQMALDRGVLAYQQCRNCARAVFYPRLSCPHCGSCDLAWRESTGHGTIYSASEIATKEGSYNVVLVDLDEGFRLMSTVPGVCLPAIGTRVRAGFEAGERAGPRLIFAVLS